MTTTTPITNGSTNSGRYFLDSYAVIEYLNGNQNYRHYFEDSDGVLTKLNLMEVYFRILGSNGPNAARDVLNTFSRYLIDFDIPAIEGAMKLRLGLKNNKHLDISYADALGYYLARQMGMKFLTGDEAFKTLESVEFIR
jgi:uncharacterized protein